VKLVKLEMRVSAYLCVPVYFPLVMETLIVSAEQGHALFSNTGVLAGRRT
jgi:hypothetical protein